MSAILDYKALTKVGEAYITTDDFVRVPGSLIDTRKYPARSLAIRVSNTGLANDASYKVRGSVDGTNFTDVITKVLAGTDQAASGATVQEAASAEVFIDDNYADKDPVLAFNYFDVMAKSTVGAASTTVVVTISAK